MARIKVINKGQNQDLIGGNFTNAASETIFSLGNFVVETNFTGRQTRNYSNTLSSFPKEITLENLGITTEQSKFVFDDTTAVRLNFDKSDIKSYVKFGSASELFRVSYTNIIQKYPASLFINSQTNLGGNSTVFNFTYDEFSNISTFRIPSSIIDNPYSLIFDYGNTSTPNDRPLRNLNISFQKYIIWRKDNPEGNEFSVVGFTGDTPSNSTIKLKVLGNPFPEITGSNTTYKVDYHIKPNPLEYNKFIGELDQLEKYFLSDRTSDYRGFIVELKKIRVLDSGRISYEDTNILWHTVDGYNPSIQGTLFQAFVNTLLSIGKQYDEIKTDLIARFLTPTSLKVYDLTDEGKMTKLLNIYGREFDDLRVFIDAIATINKTTYDKKDNIPDILVKNLAKTFGWDVFDLVTEQDITQAFFSTENEYNGTDLLPAEIDIELWRRILINTNYYWKSKGTRHAIKSMFTLIGIPEPFVNITEYIYTVEGKINPNDVTLSLEDIPSASFPFDSQGYPIAPKETNDFYFQISGNSDGGQAYIDLYRDLGFNVNRVVDNKKSWTQEGFTERVHYSTPNYYQEDSRLLINTKEVDVTLDLARGIEYDVYCYNKEVDDPFTSTGFTKPYIYINVELEVDNPTIFTLPEIPLSGSEVQLNYNGITLTPPTGATGGTGYDYSYNINNGTVEINQEVAVSATTGQDIITVTYLYDRLGSTGYTSVKYFVQKPLVQAGGTILQFDEEPKGDVQLVVNGITLSKGTSLYTGDYIINPSDRTQLLVQNNSLKNYLQTNPVIRIWSITDNGMPTNAVKKSEVHRIDSFSSSKFFFNAGINKYIYVLDYAAFDVEAIKITVNGITLTNTKDFTLNPANKKQIYLPPSISLGTVINAYYIIDGGLKYTSDTISFTAPNKVNVPDTNISVFKKGTSINIAGSSTNDGFYVVSSASTNQLALVGSSIVDEASGSTVTICKTSNETLLPADPTFPDIQDMSFLEYLELITRRLINVPRRKTITDNNGGYYPTVLKIYQEYLKRSFLPADDPLQSNGYTFENLYPFINQYNGFFNIFVNQLLPATIILRKGGILIRNTAFTRQKFRYPRGVNFDSSLGWLGTDGSEFIRKIPDVDTTPATPSATMFFLNETPSGGTTVNANELLEYDVKVSTSNFSVVSYRVRVVSPTAPTEVGLYLAVGSVTGEGPFTDDDLIQFETIEPTIIDSASANFYNVSGNQGTITLQLEVDENNDGVYVAQDSITYIINPEE